MKEIIIKGITIEKLEINSTQIDAKFLKDKEVVLTAVHYNWSALKYANVELRNDKNVMLEAIKYSACAIEYASDELKNDIEVVLAAVRKNGFTLRYASDELKNNKEVVLEAVRESGNALQHASNVLKGDKEVVLAAVRQDGNALLYVNNDLKNDEEVAFAAIRQNISICSFLNFALRNDRNFMFVAVQQNWEALKYASNELKNEKEIVFVAVQQSWRALEYVSSALKKDKEVVLEAVRQDGNALQYASDELKNDKEVVLEAVRQDGNALQYASDELKNNKELVLAAVCQNVYALQFIGLKILKNQVIQLAAQIYANRLIDIKNISIQSLFEEWYPHLSNHKNLPVCSNIMKILDDPKLQDFEKGQLLKSVFYFMSFFNEQVLQSDSASHIIQAIFTLANPSGRKKLIEHFSQLSLNQLHAISPEATKEVSNKTRFELRTKVLLARLNTLISMSIFEVNITDILYLNHLKDTKIQMVLFLYLDLVINIYPQLNKEQKTKLILVLQNDLSKPLQPESIQKFKFLTSMEAIFGKDIMIEAIDQPLELIKAYFAQEFIQLFKGKSIAQDAELIFQMSTRYEETFAKFREPMAIYTYLKSVQQVDPEVREALCEYVYHVLKGDFKQFRNEQVEDQPHLAMLYQKEGVKELWLTESSSVELSDSSVVKELDIVKLFHQKVVIDNHFQDEEVTQPFVLKEYLTQAIQNASVDCQPYLSRLEESQANLVLNTPLDKVLLARYQLEALIIKLCAKKIDIETFRKERTGLYSDGAVTSNEVEKALANDFELLYQQPSVVSSGAKFTLQFTTDPNDLLLIGTEVQGSCQNINGTSKLNKCLLGYMINGESQAIVIKDSSNRIVGRGILRLLSDDNDAPVLFLERLYLNKQLDSWKKAIISMAIEKAKVMGVPLLSKEVGVGKAFHKILCFKGGRAPFIYSDALRGVLNGRQAFSVIETHILFMPQ